MAKPEDFTAEEKDSTDIAEGDEQSVEPVEGLLDEDTVPDLQVELEAALAEVDKFKDAALRAEAEMENVRRRSQRDVENAHKFGLERFIGSLLPVVDSLEKAIEAAQQADGSGSAEGSNKAIIEGVGLVQKMLLDVLSKEGVEVVDPEGEPFDPNLHQAMSMVENPDVEPNSVVVVVQKGYTLNERLIRPAMVMVSKAASEGSKA
jgi:molecular chaperone GrpE